MIAYTERMIDNMIYDLRNCFRANLLIKISFFTFKTKQLPISTKKVSLNLLIPLPDENLMNADQRNTRLKLTS